MPRLPTFIDRFRSGSGGKSDKPTASLANDKLEPLVGACPVCGKSGTCSLADDVGEGELWLVCMTTGDLRHVG
jgi:hypothetical protein